MSPFVKVLAHVPEIGRALAEMARVTRPGGVVIAEFYNSWSLRAWLKRLLPPGAVAKATHEGQVYTRYDSPAAIRRLLPRGIRVIGERGIRIVTPTAHLMRVPLVRDALRRGEWRLADTRATSPGLRLAARKRRLEPRPTFRHCAPHLWGSRRCPPAERLPEEASICRNRSPVAMPRSTGRHKSSRGVRAENRDCASAELSRTFHLELRWPSPSPLGDGRLASAAIYAL